MKVCWMSTETETRAMRPVCWTERALATPVDLLSGIGRLGVASTWTPVPAGCGCAGVLKSATMPDRFGPFDSFFTPPVEVDTGTNAVDVLVHRLREKIDKDFEPKLLQTVRGVGYVLRPE